VASGEPQPALARAAVRALRASPIREVANAGLADPGMLAFWFGEPDEATPEFIRAAAVESLAAGETFYSHNLGLPALRAAVAAYLSRLHRPVGPERIAIASSGVSALMIATQALVGPGDRVVAVTPLWPNLVEMPRILGAQVAPVALDFGPRGWALDLDRLLAALGPGTRALYLNSPNNPTGWTIDRASQQALLAHCRRHGIWIVADDAYERLYYGAGGVAPSFLDLAAPEDRLVSVNTFSKSWLMTGWRLGWICAPEPLVGALGTLIEYNTSCAPVFVQRAGLAALDRGEPVTLAFAARLGRARDALVGALARLPGVEVAPPDGAMYAFFRLRDVDDSLAWCKRLAREARLGLAPGIAFGPEGEGFVRWCFAAAESRLAEGVARLERALAERRLRA
jgi:aspartate/methionine/tyrosine aminotransferase